MANPVMVSINADWAKIRAAREKALAGVDEAVRRTLDRFGSFTMKDAQRKIGAPVKVAPGKKESKPRTPPGSPRARTSNVYRSLKNIKYIADFQTKRVIVGPVKFGKGISGYTVPQLHEFGGNIIVNAKLVPVGTKQKTWTIKGEDENGNVVRKKHKYDFATEVAWRTVIKGGQPLPFKIPARPYMAKAYERQLPKVKVYFKDCLGKKGSIKFPKRRGK